MYFIYVAAIVCSLLCCKTNSNIINPISVNDTTYIFRKDTAINTGNISLMPVYISTEIKQQKTGKIFIALHHPKIITAPDGVFEVYLVDSTTGIEKLSSSDRAFVSLLDLYSFTAPGAKQEINIDITKQLTGMYTTYDVQSTLYLVLKFAPVTLPDGTYASNNGQISFTGVSLLLINK
jgi:hypothetical protein